MRRVAVIDPANLCSHCPHELVRLSSGTYWCPCEDCHAGGLIQGREPKDNHTVLDEPGTYRGGHSEVGEPDTFTIPDEDVWVDPIHQL